MRKSLQLVRTSFFPILYHTISINLKVLSVEKSKANSFLYSSYQLNVKKPTSYGMSNEFDQAINKRKIIFSYVTESSI